MSNVSKVSIDDPRLSEDARKILRAALTIFAKRIRHRLPEGEAIKGAIELFERGYLMIEKVGDGVRFHPCLPENAPQLQSDLAFIEQFGNA